MTDFVHLHLHTEYSLLDGAAKVDDLVDHLVKNNIDCCAVTDHGNMYASLYFAEECVKKGIKYIIGCELYATDDYRDKRPGTKTEHIIVLAKNKTGYKNIVKLDSLSYIDGFYGKPRIDYKLLKEHHEGVICLSACLAGRMPQLLLNGDYDGAKEWAKEMKDVFGEDFYIEIQDHGIQEEKQVIPQLIQIARELDIQLVATNDVHYIYKEDWEAQDILLCIQTKKTLADPKRMKFETREFYMKTGDEMAALFDYIPEAISNTRVIADKIEEPVFDLKPNGTPIRDTSLIPLYTPDDGSTSPEYLTRLTWEGLPKRYNHQAAGGVRAGNHHQDGICRLFPHRLGLYQLVAPERHSRGAGQRLGRRQYRRVLHRHHRRRSLALRTHFRAFFESRPSFHARLRRGLLHEAPL